jgi:hypothetical protein
MEHNLGHLNAIGNSIVNSRSQEVTIWALEEAQAGLSGNSIVNSHSQEVTIWALEEAQAGLSGSLPEWEQSQSERQIPKWT